jgi:Plasmid replication region DNA-binding N-term
MNATLETDIAALKERFDDTQALYREVCAVMFFRYGETPTANRLYQLVRRGSMSAPAKALRGFWDDLRDKSRIDVGQPDLPPEVAAAAGELASTLWRLCADTGNAGLEVFRDEARRDVAAAQEATRAASQERDTAVREQARLSDADAARTAQVAELNARAVELQTAVSMLREQLDASRAETSAATSALAEARRDFARELEKLRESAELGERRLIAVEKRALLEIEHERSLAVKLKGELQAGAEKLRECVEAHQVERQTLREEIVTLQSRSVSAESDRKSLAARLSGVESELASRDQTVQSLHAELAVARARVEQQESTRDLKRDLKQDSSAALSRRPASRRRPANSKRSPLDLPAGVFSPRKRAAT